jgi:hypothetical protein
MFSDLSTAGIYTSEPLTTGFYTELAAAGAPVTTGTTAAVSFDLTARSPGLNPVWIGQATPLGTSLSVTATPLEVEAGAEAWLAVAGPGLDRVDGSGLSVPGRGVTVDTGSLVRRTITCNGRSLPTLVFRILVDVQAAAGARTLFFATDGERAALTGGLRVVGNEPSPTPTSPPVATPTPTPEIGCPGDCNGDASVTIDELVRGVNIALQQAALSTCPAFDGNGDGAVTVDELVRGVAAALAGC